MPAGRMEVIGNIPLTGEELRTLLERDFERLLDGFALLSKHLAYGRVGYEITIRTHLDNPHHPSADTAIQSRPQSKQSVAADPGLAAVSTPPLASPLSNAVAAAVRVARSVFSPNAERLREGLPVSAQHRDQDGSMVTKLIHYPPDPDAPDTSTREDDAAQAEMVRDWHLDSTTPPAGPSEP